MKSTGFDGVRRYARGTARGETKDSMKSTGFDGTQLAAPGHSTLCPGPRPWPWYQTMSQVGPGLLVAGSGHSADAKARTQVLAHLRRTPSGIQRWCHSQYLDYLNKNQVAGTPTHIHDDPRHREIYVRRFVPCHAGHKWAPAACCSISGNPHPCRPLQNPKKYDPENRYPDLGLKGVLLIGDIWL